MSAKARISTFKKNSIDLLKFLCGSENGKVNRSGLWTMIATISTVFLLLLAYVQFQDLNETTAAEFSHKIKEDLYNEKNMRLITLFDNEALVFRSTDEGEVWFELDTLAYFSLTSIESDDLPPLKYNVFDVDELLQAFEELSFY